ncbi:MAG: hypothetical protein IKW13_03525 [Thermoguttaceae bacterium]|nr:hypothetical protein [Thermoguttaceae bacterium]
MSDSDRPNDDSRLQADAQYGLKFVSETTPDDVFAIRSDDAPSPAAVPTPNPNDGPTVAPPPPSSAPDVYGLAEPEPDVYGLAEPIPTPPQPSAVPPKVDAPKLKKTKRAPVAEDREPEYSLEEIYERKRREREENAEEYVRGERPELPARPYIDRIMKPFCSISFLLRLGIISGLAFIPLFLATWLFSRHFSTVVAEMLTKNEELGALTAFFRCVWADKIIFTIFCFGWGVFSIPHSFHIFSETAAGADDIDEWPEYNFVGGLGQFLWLTALVGLAGIPGAFLFGVLGLNSLVGFTLSGTLLTPFFFLGCMQTDTLFGLATKETLASLKRVGKSWLNFYFIAFAFLFGTIGLSLAAIGAVVSAKGSASRAVFAAAIVSLIFSFVPALYLRFLGRLAWIIEDDVRRRAEEEADAETDDDSDEDADA